VNSSFDEAKKAIKKAYADEPGKGEIQEQTEAKAWKQRLNNAQESFDKTVQEPKRKKEKKLKRLEENHTNILNQVQANYARFRVSEETPLQIFDPTQKIRFYSLF